MSADAIRVVPADVPGERKAPDELLPLVYGELRKLAASKLAALPPGQTLKPTALVHEGYLRLIGSGPEAWNSRGHFFAAGAEAMRRILVERARQRAAQKRGGGLQRVDLEEVDLAQGASSEVLLALDDALQRYAGRDPTGAEMIKLRFSAGLPYSQAAELLGISERTAKRT